MLGRFGGTPRSRASVDEMRGSFHMGLDIPLQAWLWIWITASIFDIDGRWSRVHDAGSKPTFLVETSRLLHVEMHGVDEDQTVW